MNANITCFSQWRQTEQTEQVAVVVLDGWADKAVGINEVMTEVGGTLN